MDDREPPIRPCDGGGQAVVGDAALDSPCLIGGLAGGIEDAPGERAAALEAGVLGPGENRLAAGIAGEGGMLAVAAAAAGMDRGRGLAGPWVDPREVSLPLGLPRRDRALRALDER